MGGRRPLLFVHTEVARDHAFRGEVLRHPPPAGSAVDAMYLTQASGQLVVIVTEEARHAIEHDLGA